MTTGAEHLKSLHTALVDNQHGYELAMADAANLGLADVVKGLIARRIKDARELSTVLAEMGEKTTESDTFTVSVNRSIFAIRSLFVGLESTAMRDLVETERQLLTLYDDELSNAATHPDAAQLCSILKRQRRSLGHMIDTIEIQHAHA